MGGILPAGLLAPALSRCPKSGTKPFEAAMRIGVLGLRFFRAEETCALMRVCTADG